MIISKKEYQELVGSIKNTLYHQRQLEAKDKQIKELTEVIQELTNLDTDKLIEWTVNKYNVGIGYVEDKKETLSHEVYETVANSEL